MAKKNSFRSAPRIVSGRDSDRCTLLIRLACVMFSSLLVGISGSREKPGQKVHCGDSHTHAKQHPGQHALRSTLPKSEREPRHHDRDQRKSARDRAGERCFQNVHRVLTPGIAPREGRSCQHEREANGDREMALPGGNQKLAKKSFHHGVLPVLRSQSWSVEGAHTTDEITSESH